MGCDRFYKVAGTFLAAGLLLAGCHGAGKPCMRFGTYFGEVGGMQFPNPDMLGKQNYKTCFGEINGMLYTCKGGFIDLGHVRESADRAAYLFRTIYWNLAHKQTKFSFHFIEPSQYQVRITYPTNWDTLDPVEREKITKEVSAHVGQYLAHTMMIWHEMLTWYGWKSTMIFSEKISSFSCEDSYSDVLGARLGAQAVYDQNSSYEDALIKLLYQEMARLDVQSAETAQKAANWVHGRWYSGKVYPFINIKVHNFDIGLNDGTITPMLVPAVCPNAVAEPYQVPTAVALRENGFKIEGGIDPRTQKAKIYESIGLDKNSLIIPEVHFPLMMAYIEKGAKNPKRKNHERLILSDN